MERRNFNLVDLIIIILMLIVLSSFAVVAVFGIRGY